MADSVSAEKATTILSQTQIDDFIANGVLVVDDILTVSQLQNAKAGLHRTLLFHGVDYKDLAGTGSQLRNLSSTNGSGGVLDLFYSAWKLQIASNPRLFLATNHLWDAAYCHMGETREGLADNQLYRWHPYGPFDSQKGYMYVDRIGYRIPTELAEKLGSDGDHNNGKKKVKPIQRSLTPHLDCCPNRMFTEVSKWRPIQCFVSLTDNLEPNTGGFEAAHGFHQEFDAWSKTRPPSTVLRKTQGDPEELSISAPCIGDYTHIRPKEDADVFARIRHIPLRAGSAVFWDNRIPHSNAYRHNGQEPRAVIYCSFLPDVDLNRRYVRRQLLNYQRRRPPTDQWINGNEQHERLRVESDDAFEGNIETDGTLFRKLMGIEEW